MPSVESKNCIQNVLFCYQFVVIVNCSLFSNLTVLNTIAKMSFNTSSSIDDQCQCRQMILESIECPICLEPLTTDNCVLSCQHTFCKICLGKLIDASNGCIITCPVCRFSCKKLDPNELPRNYILNNILVRLDFMCRQQQSENKRNRSPKAKRRCLEDTVIILDDNEDQENNLEMGTIPSCKAKFDFKLDGNEYLEFKKGDIIHVRKRVDKKWAEGKLNGKIGIFPIDHVKLDRRAALLIKYSGRSL